MALIRKESGKSSDLHARRKLGKTAEAGVSEKVAHKGLEWENAGFLSTLMQSLQKTPPQPPLLEKLFHISLN